MTAIVDTSAGLAAFVRTIETGSFSDAARLLGASPSAVSKSVARLEARLGVRLIQRSTRTLALTAEGALYFERVAPLIQALADAEQALRTPDDVSGLLRVAAPSDLGRTVFAGWAERFARAHPRLKLELGIADRQVDLIREGYDVAIRVGALLDNRLTARRLTTLQPVLVAAPAYLARRGQPAERADLAEHACLRYLTPAGPFPWTWADGSSLVPDGPFDTNDGVVLRQAALAGAGIAQLARIAVADDLAAGRLDIVLPHLPMPGLEVHALHAYGRQAPQRVRLFIAFLQQQFAADHA
ncbi:LysR family transcriptional regulator [Massilia aurea]|jgi:DNA-binding transcriptional LysR family regulator|uniref:LysR family transcriptional regulator n=1 Tax=Massilia aurea TaxID=373040 RepID=UPI00216273B8|nr:LysR family transcriptional regulator [Massilia aurea]MCS0707542.1 LysR family transcriptional regulator [Massilia aurea]